MPGVTLTAIAGTGSAGFNDGPALEAEFNGARDIALDEEGNLFITDVLNNRLRKLDVNGMVSTVIGNGTKESGVQTGLLEQAQFWSVGNIKYKGKDEYLIKDHSGDIYLINFKQNIMKLLLSDPTVIQRFVEQGNTIYKFFGAMGPWEIPIGHSKATIYQRMSDAFYYRYGFKLYFELNFINN